MGFKVDSSFLKYVTMGALGSRKVLAQMTRSGLRPIELERYSCCNKIWSTKVKRLRLPDLLCLSTGIRVEVRTKSTLEIKMSEAPDNPERRWSSGLRPQDLIAFIYCDSGNGDFVVAEQAELFTVRSLSDAEAQSKLGPPKSASEGAERDRAWPSTVAKNSGRVLAVEDGKISTSLDTGRRQTYRLNGKNPYVQAEDIFSANTQFIAGVPATKVTFPRPGAQNWDPRADLRSTNSIDRYVAVKALGYVGQDADIATLLSFANNDADARVALEAAGAAARLRSREAIELVFRSVEDPREDYLRMEAIFILSELAEDANLRTIVSNYLVSIADNARYIDDEVRQAAIWGIGKAGCKDNFLIMNYLDCENHDEAIHAINAFDPDCNDEHIDRLIDILSNENSSRRKRCSAGYILCKIAPASRSVPRLLRHLQNANRDASEWIISVLGQMLPSQANPLLTDQRILAQLKPMQLLSQEINWTKCDINAEAISFLNKQNIY